MLSYSSADRLTADTINCARPRWHSLCLEQSSSLGAAYWIVTCEPFFFRVKRRPRLFTWWRNRCRASHGRRSRAAPLSRRNQDKQVISGGRTVCEFERTSALSRRESRWVTVSQLTPVECTLTRKPDSLNARQVQPTLHPSTHLFGLPNGSVGADTDRAQLHADALVDVSFEFDAITLKVQGNAYCSHETSVE